MKKVLLSICVALTATLGFSGVSDAKDHPSRKRPPSYGKRPPSHRPPEARPRPPQHRPPTVRPRPPRPPAVRPRPPVHRPPVYRPPVHRPPVYRPPVYRPPVVVVPPPVYQPPYRVQYITCGSYNYHPNSCYTGMRVVQRVNIVRNLSHAPCILGQSFGIQNGSIYVSQGCSAEFRVEGY